MSKSHSNAGLSRRRFLTMAGLAAAVGPNIIVSSVNAQGRKPSPSNRITMGVIGWGMQGPENTNALMNCNGCQVVAACEVDKIRLGQAVDTINSFYGNKDCKGYSDYKEMLDRADIDAVMIAIPDHWHCLAATDAANKKKDIYGEKPLGKTIAEQQAIVRAVQKNERIFQTGSWQRSTSYFRKAAELVRNGHIGAVKRVEVGLMSGFTDFGGLELSDQPSTPPAELDYERWIGPSKLLPYIERRSHINWRYNYNTGGGQLMDWIGHHCDIAHWGLDLDKSGPLEIEGVGEFPDPNAVWNTCTKFRCELKYPGNLTMIIAGGYDDIAEGTKWIGSDGWVHVDRGNFEGSKSEWEDYKDLPDNLAKVRLYKSDNHCQNFIECCKSRKPPITPAETGHHSTIPGHLSHIAMTLKRKIRWDAKTETIIGDDEASKMLTRAYRAPYQMPV
jgi:predicted dehydrogenase